MDHEYFTQGQREQADVDAEDAWNKFIIFSKDKEAKKMRKRMHDCYVEHAMTPIYEKYGEDTTRCTMKTLEKLSTTSSTLVLPEEFEDEYTFLHMALDWTKDKARHEALFYATAREAAEDKGIAIAEDASVIRAQDREMMREKAAREAQIAREKDAREAEIARQKAAREAGIARDWAVVKEAADRAAVVKKEKEDKAAAEIAQARADATAEARSVIRAKEREEARAEARAEASVASRAYARDEARREAKAAMEIARGGELV